MSSVPSIPEQCRRQADWCKSLGSTLYTHFLYCCAHLAQHRGMVANFLSALHSGDFEALVKLLDPEVVVRADQAAIPAGAPREIRGAQIAAQQAIASSRGAKAARLALINGVPGLIVAPGGKLFRVLTFSFAESAIAEIDVLGEPAGLAKLEIALLD